MIKNESRERIIEDISECGKWNIPEENFELVI